MGVRDRCARKAATGRPLCSELVFRGAACRGGHGDGDDRAAAAHCAGAVRRSVVAARRVVVVGRASGAADDCCSAARTRRRRAQAGGGQGSATEALTTETANHRSACARARGARTGALITWVPSERKTLSKSRVNLLSRSRIRWRTESYSPACAVHARRPRLRRFPLPNLNRPRLSLRS
jgi:hypothetical protein